MSLRTALSRLDFRLGSRAFYATSLILLWLAYAAVIALTGAGRGSAVYTMMAAGANVASLALSAGLARAFLRHFMLKRGALLQVLAHTVLGLCFALFWYWLLMVLLGAVAGDSALQFSVVPFPGPAAAWQLFQGLFAYALVAVLAHCETYLVPRDGEAAASGGPFRFFIRQGEDIHPLNPSDVILIRGADDYSEIVSTSGTHLVRLSLSTLTQRLGERFLRVHRSCIVNVEKVERAEPAGGGRMLVHMSNGEAVSTSRAGARLLRERVI